MNWAEIVKGETYAVKDYHHSDIRMVKIVDTSGWTERSEYPYDLTPDAYSDHLLGVDLTEGESVLVLVLPAEVVSTWDRYNAIDAWLSAERHWLRVESETRWNTRGPGADEAFRVLFAEMGLELTRVDFENWGSEIGFQVKPYQSGKDHNKGGGN